MTKHKKTILVVDDEQDVHHLIKEYLAPLDVIIYSAYTGEQGVEQYKELVIRGQKPDLVVMDLNLSGSISREELLKQMNGEEMDGVETSKEILKIDKHALIIGFTAYANLNWGERLKKIGAKEVYSRGLGFQGFANKVSELLS